MMLHVCSVFAYLAVAQMQAPSLDPQNDNDTQENPPQDANSLTLPLGPDGLEDTEALLQTLGPGVADALPKVLDLAQSLKIFHSRGFDLLVAELTILEARGALSAAGQVSNPQLGGTYGHSFEYNVPDCPGCAANGYGVTLSDNGALFDIISGKRGLRVDVAHAVLDATKHQRDDTQRTLDYLVKTQFLNVAIDKTNLHFAQQVQTTYASTTELFVKRYRQGAVSEADLARIETEYFGAQQQVDMALQQLQTDKVNLAFLLGVRGIPPEFDIDDTWMEKAGSTLADRLSAAEMLDVARAHRPDLLAQTYQCERAQAAISSARRQLFPEAQLSLTYQQQGSGNNAVTPPTLTGGLTLTLPLFYQYQGEIRQAEADAATQDVLRHKLEAQVASDVSLSRINLRATRSQLERMRVHTRVRAARALELVRFQYEKGAASLLDLMDAQRTFIATNQGYIGTMQNYWTAIFQLEQAVATEFES